MASARSLCRSGGTEIYQLLKRIEWVVNVVAATVSDSWALCNDD